MALPQPTPSAAPPELPILPPGVELPLEVRVHGRGGQGGVTCAKLVASIYAELRLHVQTFGDYGSERAGAPIRAFTRVDRVPVANRNKVYRPRHLLVLDAGLMSEEALDGVGPGALVLLNTPGSIEGLSARHPEFRLATLDATAIARRHGIGTSALVIVNTTIAGAYARALGLRWEVLERAYGAQGLEEDLPAAREAWEAVAIREPRSDRPLAPPRPPPPGEPIVPIVEQLRDIPAPFKTGTWRTQMPRYRSHAAPCNASCPAGNDVVGFVQALNDGGVPAAAEVLFRTQPLPSVCGRVCPAPCMTGCNRATYDGAVNIRGLERWIGDHSPPAPQPVASPEKRHRVAIVGSGPAGLAAAFALAREGHAVTIHEGEPRLGGVLRTGIPSYRLPHDVLDRDIERVLSMGVEARCGTFLDAAGVEALARTSDAVILAAGLPRLTALDCPGAGLRGVAEGIRFLDAVKNGAGARLSGHVVVVGGGNTAIDCARTALRCGAGKVTIAYRRGRKEMPAIAGEIDEAVDEGVALLTHRQPVRVHGEGRVTGVELAEVELGEPDKSGRRRPVVTDRTAVLPCDAVLLAIGQGADMGILPSGWTARAGRAERDGVGRNLWLAGDMATSEGTVTHAIGDGRRVAARVVAALDGRPEPIWAKPPPEEIVAAAHVRFSHFEVRRPQPERHADPLARRTSWDEVNQGLAGPEEAARCFSCGHCTRCDTCLLYCPEGIITRAGDGYAVDGDYCKGCGMCVAECPRRAMEMTSELTAEVRS